MATRSLHTALYVLLGLLMFDALLEMSFVAATVAFLHNRAGGSFLIQYRGNFYNLHGKPAHVLADQGHTSNGAAGTALILIGIGGFLTFPLLRRNASTGRPTLYSRITLPLWLVLSFLSMLLTFAALVYTQVVTSQHSGQTIDQSVASRLNNREYPNYVAYPLLSWTPENWFAAVLKLNLANASDRSLIRTKYNVMKGWRWNLIPLFLLGVAVFVVGLMEARKWKQTTSHSTIIRENKEREIESTEEHRVEPPVLPTVPRKPVPQQQPVGTMA